MKKTPSSFAFGAKKNRMVGQPKPTFARHFRLPLPREVEAALQLARHLNARTFLS